MQRINRNIPPAQSRRDMPPRKRASDIRKGYLGDGFQRAAFGFFQGAVQRGAGSLGMSAAAQQAAGFGGVDACAGTQADFALAAGQFTDR